MKRNFATSLLLAVSFVVAFTGCSKDDDNDSPTNPGTPAITVDSPTQTSFKVNNVATSYVSAVSNVESYYSNSSSISTPPNTSEIVFGYGFQKVVGSNYVNLFDVELGTYEFVTSDSASFVNFFPKQSVAYSNAAANGVRIVYYDENGDQWASDYGSAAQTGSTFVIQDTKFRYSGSDKYMKVKASFSCNVYDGSGSFKTITDGVAVFDFWSEY
jgi:hypothetical protein